MLGKPPVKANLFYMREAGSGRPECGLVEDAPGLRQTDGRGDRLRIFGPCSSAGRRVFGLNR